MFGCREREKKIREKGEKVRKAGELKASPVNLINLLKVDFTGA